jgi:hypothetical protein
MTKQELIKCLELVEDDLVEVVVYDDGELRKISLITSTIDHDGNQILAL